ncbi:hypothetical protein HYV11_04010 [Candidatus Dependentiae bacterium]|nr:hypothetical protein [Candidatus Dependentiae bacterium]
MKSLSRYSLSIVFFGMSLFFSNYVFSSAIEPDATGEQSTVQEDLERLKLGLTELQERTNHILPDQVKIDSFHARYQDMILKFGGKCTEEMFNSANLTYLNNKIINDTSFFMRATGDFFMDVSYGKYEKPRILFHNTIRLRYKWGSGTDIRADGEALPVLDSFLQTKGALVNKHVLWNRELWLKFGIGNLDAPNVNFFEIGAFPYEVGRGISFGAAYKTAGFLGFTPSFSIDQFAPGCLLHINPLPEKLFFEVYLALLENQNTSYKNNNAKVRTQEIESLYTFRGPGRQSYAAIFKGSWDALKQSDNKITIEPYVVYFQALDQKLEYIHDIDSLVTTYGFSVEGKYKKFGWGFETSLNQGNVLIKAIDRNAIKLVRDSEGFVIEQYTKVYSQNPALVDEPLLADVSNVNKAIVDAAPKGVSYNGLEIGNSCGIIDSELEDIPGCILYNAYDRFRPKQNQSLDGYMFIADCSYQIVDEVLNISLGVGYASGDLDQQQNANTMSSQALLNQKYSGFVTLQSVYSGTRLRHLVIFNEGVPRFDVQNPNEKFPKQNITPPLADSKIEFTNIAFAGTRVEVKIPAWKKYKAVIAPNIIGYWCPEPPTTKCGKLANNYMGTELTTEISAQFYSQFKLYSYIGLLFPGGYYKDMRGTPYNDEVTGSSIGYIANIGISFAF